MDLTRPVTYRGASLNTVTPTVGRLGLTGCIVEQADVRATQYVGASEKRRLADGLDSIEPYMGLHRFVLSGMVYGQTRGETYDRLQTLKEAFSPTKALLESPLTKGFVPFTFFNTIARSVDCRPMGLRYQYDATKAGTNAKVAGKEDAVGLGIRWTAELLVNTSALLDCGEWPPTPPPPPPVYYPIPGDVIDGYRCTVNGWALPWCSGTGDGVLTSTVPATNVGIPSVETVKMYDGATYRLTFTAEHHHVGVGQNNLGGAVGAGVFGIPVAWSNNPDGTGARTNFFGGPDTTPLTSRVIDVRTWENGNPCVPVWAFEGAGHFDKNVVGSIVTCAVSYLFGPDPRFIDLPTCPDPDWPG